MSGSTGAFSCGGLEKRRDRLDARAHRAIEFAERKALAFDVANHPWRDELARGIDDAANDALWRDGRGDRAARIHGLDAAALMPVRRDAGSTTMGCRSAWAARTVSSCSTLAKSGTIGSTWCAFMASTSRSCGPASAARSSTAKPVLARAAVAFYEREAVAAQCGEVRAPPTRVTSAPLAARRAPTKPPIEPAPTMQTRFTPAGSATTWRRLVERERHFTTPTSITAGARALPAGVKRVCIVGAGSIGGFVGARPRRERR